MSELDELYIPHLKAQFERARPILFTGAGFSLAAKNIANTGLPSGPALSKLLWPICFPSEDFDASATLPDLFDYAMRRAPGQLKQLLSDTFTVSDSDLPEWYARVFSLPWQKVYTLNIDNLEQAVSRVFPVSRTLHSRSFHHVDQPLDLNKKLEVLHLNGLLEEGPENITFSPVQYAQRLVSPDPTFRRLAAELVSSPFVFIGSPLDEATLWQSIEARRRKGGRDVRELRPRSYLISPSLPPAKRALLGEYNVVWLPMTAEEFSNTVLPALTESAQIGLTFIGSQQKVEAEREIPYVSDLAVHPEQKNEYLLGYEPIWADIQSGRAIEREHDAAVWKLIEQISIKEDPRGLIVISGTSGSGKSTALMRAALNASAVNQLVGWIDPEEGFTPRDIRLFARKQVKPFVLAIDDADLYGSQLASLVKDILGSTASAIVILAMRSGRVDRFISPGAIPPGLYFETTVPLLTDDDIEKLIEVLLRENRPGRLKGLPRKEQISLFREQADRELIVAMIQATSGRKFSEKVVEEFTDLTSEASRIYGLVAVATSFRFGLTSQDVLIALADENNASLNALETLVSRKLLRRVSDGSVFIRHRVIADVVRDHLEVNGQLSAIVQGLAVVAASRSAELKIRGSKARRILRAILNHAFLQRSLGFDTTRNLYGSLEEVLAWDYHYWLQRGSFEVEAGDLSLAENFLNQARGLAPDDPYIESEWAYLLFAQANADPTAPGASQAVADATRILQGQMAHLQRKDGYAFHIMGSQGLAWCRRGIPTQQEKNKYLHHLLADVKVGVLRFPGDRDLSNLQDDIRKEKLKMVIDPDNV